MYIANHKRISLDLVKELTTSLLTITQKYNAILT